MEKRRGALALVCMLLALVVAWWGASRTPPLSTAPDVGNMQEILITHTIVGNTQRFFGTLPISNCDEVATAILATPQHPTQLSLNFTTSRVASTCTGIGSVPFAISYTAQHAATLSQVSINNTVTAFRLVERTP